MLLSWAFWASCSQQCVSLCSDVDLLIWEFRGCISCVFPDDDVKHFSCDGLHFQRQRQWFLAVTLKQNSGTSHSHISECKGGNNWTLTTHKHMTLFEDPPRYDPFHIARLGGTILHTIFLTLGSPHFWEALPCWHTWNWLSLQGTLPGREAKIGGKLQKCFVPMDRAR